VKIKIFIVDDEAPARRELRYLLAQVGGVDIAGEASNGTAALKGIMDSMPHVVFLDVQMPSLNGLELSEVLCRMPERPLIIFATAFEKYALAAFDVEAFDYVLKPFTLERIKKAIAKAAKTLNLHPERTATSSGFETTKSFAPLQENPEFAKKICLYKGEKIIPVTAKNILFAKIEEGEISVRTIDGSYGTKFTLNELESRLAPHGFIRVHRSALVNINHVQEVIPWFNGSYKLIMNDREKTEVLVSRYNAKEVKNYFNL
jgi:two-component system response regulator LytT